jgi:hypothetical protein
MFKEIFHHIDLGRIGEAGMLLFLVVFVAITIRAIMTSRAEMERWAELPLKSGGADESTDREETR